MASKIVDSKYMFNNIYSKTETEGDEELSMRQTGGKKEIENKKEKETEKDFSSSFFPVQDAITHTVSPDLWMTYVINSSKVMSDFVSDLFLRATLRMLLPKRENHFIILITIFNI